MESKEPKDEEKPVDIRELQKEILEMRQQIPQAYKVCLEKNFEDFKNRLTNIAAQRKTIEYSDSYIPDMSIFESKPSQRYDVEDLTQYINNAQMFVNNLKKNNDKRK